MSDDIIKRLREAIAAGPTPGPWGASNPMSDVHSVSGPEHWQGVCRAYGRANCVYIAAASPDNIAALLDRLDDFETNGAMAVRWAPSSAHWSNELRRLFGSDAREGIDNLERKLRDQTDRLDAAERELERERMRLVACGVVAGANTPESAANARQMHPDHLSGSCDAVACAVDREMALRAENERLVAKIGELVDACALLRVENSKSEREALCWQELDRFISTCDPANAAAWKRLRKRIDEDIGRAIDAARAAEKGKE